MEKQQLKDNLTSGHQWHRLLYMVLFGVVLYLVMMVLCIVVVVQVLFALVTSNTNKNIVDFSTDLCRYIYQIVLFLTYNDDRKPYPFNAWQDDDTALDDIEEDEHQSIVDDVPVRDSEIDDQRKPSDRSD